MEIHEQECVNCGSRNVRNILVQEPGAPMAVYVRCLGCGEFVARYRVSEYYHHGRSVESYLRSLGSHEGESGRNFLAEFQGIQQDAERGYEEVLRRLNGDGEKGEDGGGE